MHTCGCGVDGDVVVVALTCQSRGGLKTRYLMFCGWTEPLTIKGHAGVESNAIVINIRYGSVGSLITDCSTRPFTNAKARVKRRGVGRIVYGYD